MADSKQETILAWLRDAHAMEAGTVDSLERLIERADAHPPLRAQLQKHLTESRRQRDEIERELDRLGADTSKLKDLTMKLSGVAAPLLAQLAADDLPKNCLAALGYENFEIASYQSLRAAADELGMPELRAMCERFIREEQETADFLLQHLPEITRNYLRGLSSDPSVFETGETMAPAPMDSGRPGTYR